MNEHEHLQALIDIPTRARRLYPRGGFEGLEANTLQVLIAVQLLVEPTVGDLVHELALAQGTVSTALARLHERDLVVPTADPDDGRRERQRITRTGHKVVERYAGEARGHLTCDG